MNFLVRSVFGVCTVVVLLSAVCVETGRSGRSRSRARSGGAERRRHRSRSSRLPSVAGALSALPRQLSDRERLEFGDPPLSEQLDFQLLPRLAVTPPAHKQSTDRGFRLEGLELNLDSLRTGRQHDLDIDLGDYDYIFGGDDDDRSGNVRRPTGEDTQDTEEEEWSVPLNKFDVDLQYVQSHFDILNLFLKEAHRRRVTDKEIEERVLNKNGLSTNILRDLTDVSTRLRETRQEFNRLVPPSSPHLLSVHEASLTDLSPRDLFLPSHVLLHRCENCCQEPPSHVRRDASSVHDGKCLPSEEETVTSPFMLVHRNPSANKVTIRPRDIVRQVTFINHTQCHCVSCVERCPWPLYPITPPLQPGESSCPVVCACHPTSTPTSQCNRILQGLQPLAHKQSRCVSNGQCQAPRCVVGVYDIKTRRCPRFYAAVYP